MNRGLLTAIPAVFILAGCASGAGDSAGTSSASVQAAASSAASSAASAEASSTLCTTHACIADDAQKALVGLVAQDNSVSTKATCKRSTARINPGNTWTVMCTVTYSDGSEATGYANLLPSSGKITFEPED